MSRNGKVVVAMSGGVDSSVAAALLREQGFDPVGVLMRNGIEDAAPGRGAGDGGACRTNAKTCCSASDAADARRVADRLGIPFYVLDFEREFGSIIDHFVAEYNRGRTPNPCVMCNQRLKFGKLFAYAEAVGAEFVATGHYARMDRSGPEPALHRGLDDSKDQSYALFGVRRRFLPRMLLPVGGFRKPEIRARAAEMGLAVADKPDSQDICFVPSNNYVDLLRARSPETVRPGEVVDTAGRVVGRHEGFQTVTVGQRKGLRIALGKPVYVVRTDPATNRIVVGERADLLCRSATVSKVNWLVDPPAVGSPLPVTAQVRYNHDGGPATLSVSAEGPETVELAFDPPVAAVTPGQAAVFYDGDRVLGGGWIDRAG
jgi:tRNA-specific 2-thiouridylase